MKSILIQTLLKRDKKKSFDIDPSTEQIKKTANSIFNWALVALTIIVVVSIAIGA